MNMMPAHALFDNFLPPDLRQELLDWTMAHQDDFTPSRVNVGGRGAQDNAIRQSVQMPMPKCAIRAEIKSQILANMAQIFAGVGMKVFDIDRMEMGVAVHGNGGFYRTHTDVATQGNAYGIDSDRLISAVYYFHNCPQKFSGGELAIYPFDGQGAPKLIEPLDNRLLVFPSFAAHEVRQVRCADDFADRRFSLNVWLRKARNPVL